ncbi:MAG: hypothetical protein RLO06_18490 [Parvibaculum sp.]
MKANALLVGVLIWAGGLAAAVYSTSQLDEALSRQHVVATARALMPRPIGLRAKPVPASVYKRIADTLRSTNEVVEFQATADTLAIRTRDTAEYASWMLAITTAIAQAPEYRWTVKELCAGPICPGAPLTAEIAAHQIQTEVRQ